MTLGTAENSAGSDARCFTAGPEATLGMLRIGMGGGKKSDALPTFRGSLIRGPTRGSIALGPGHRATSRDPSLNGTTARRFAKASEYAPSSFQTSGSDVVLFPLRF